MWYKIKEWFIWSVFFRYIEYSLKFIILFSRKIRLETYAGDMIFEMIRPLIRTSELKKIANEAKKYMVLDAYAYQDDGNISPIPIKKGGCEVQTGCFRRSDCEK